MTYALSLIDVNDVSGDDLGTVAKNQFRQRRSGSVAVVTT
jgi:hypothetical protein